ncbi:flagellar hook-associated protein FlgK [Pseudorhodoplanes sinuspersici]|uniref:Flagellar hook-associated protein 1 n=1 Tax=Pseudorhodoplanes sinuspersici TaxID=1235591 RepID=A0A1W6ZU17_9HYPH|nr:flagellar hook-associated protein FlgK [Pseudorhodoplanes sinuspersici]ARQ00788.1 flagellar hook-associated protein FlgK [Pseudorhodoplanes sinuspersici]RKE72401.1 flagellar hook-associated protein 1 FlgK [Pseudorhodoplanes sinuspersici]
MSLSQALNTSVAGLKVAQTGLSVIASNVANAETPGYVRKTLHQSAVSIGAAGVSVRTESINRELDAYLQRQLRTEAAGGAYASLRADFYSQLQRIYGDPGAEATLETSYSNFTTALQGLSTSPDAPAARSAVISAAQVLAQQLNSMSTAIQGMRSDAELGLSDSVQRANNAMQQIAAINRQLALNTRPDAATASLLDQRDAYIDELSQLMDIRVVPGDLNQINVFTNSGVQLVGTDAAKLKFDPQGTMTAAAQWSPDAGKRTVGTLTLVTPTGGEVDLLMNGSIRSGEIAAYIEMRDDILVQAQAQLDELAAMMASALSDATIPSTAVTSGAQTGFDIDTAGLLNGNKINLTYTDNTGQQRNVTIVRVDDTSALPLSNDATADPNDTVIGVSFTGGLADVAQALNSHFNGKVNFSASGNTLRILDDGAANNTTINAVTATVTRTGLSGDGAELPLFTDGFSAYTGAITGSGSQSIGLAGRLTVNPDLVADPSKLVVYQAGTEAGDATRPNFILDKLTKASVTFSAKTGIGSVAAPFKGTISSFLRQVISVQGEAAANAENLAIGQNVVVNALKERVADDSAVNIDVEMANLLNLQNAYGANARVMSVVKEMFDQLMNMV